ncbi:MAG: hypothetical protein ACLT8E_08210 [Akkermansia sp.]
MTIKLSGTAADYAETEHVTREAFWNHYSRCNEHYLLISRSPLFIPELDVVAVHGGHYQEHRLSIRHQDR